MSKRMDAIEERLTKLEWAEKRRTHRHMWRCSKSSSDGGSIFWSWKCENAEDGCDQPSGGTNHLSGLPDYFPDILR